MRKSAVPAAVSLTWIEGSKDFDDRCPTIDGCHLMVYTLSGTGRLFQRQGKRELHADFSPGSVMIRPAGSTQRVYGCVPERMRVGVSERLVAKAKQNCSGAPEMNARVASLTSWLVSAPVFAYSVSGTNKGVPT